MIIWVCLEAVLFTTRRAIKFTAHWGFSDSDKLKYSRKELALAYAILMMAKDGC